MSIDQSATTSTAVTVPSSRIEQPEDAVSPTHKISTSSAITTTPATFNFLGRYHRNSRRLARSAFPSMHKPVETIDQLLEAARGVLASVRLNDHATDDDDRNGNDSFREWRDSEGWPVDDSQTTTNGDLLLDDHYFPHDNGGSTVSPSVPHHNHRLHRVGPPEVGRRSTALINSTDGERNRGEERREYFSSDTDCSVVSDSLSSTDFEGHGDAGIGVNNGIGQTNHALGPNSSNNIIRLSSLDDAVVATGEGLVAIAGFVRSNSIPVNDNNDDQDEAVLNVVPNDLDNGTATDAPLDPEYNDMSGDDEDDVWTIVEKGKAMLAESLKSYPSLPLLTKLNDTSSTPHIDGSATPTLQQWIRINCPTLNLKLQA